MPDLSAIDQKSSPAEGTDKVVLAEGVYIPASEIGGLAAPLASNVIYEPNSNSPIVATNVQDALDEVALPAAINVSYELSSVSPLTSTNVQDAIDELSASIGGVSSVNGDTGAVILPQSIIIACSDETTNITAGTTKVTFRMPYAFTLTEIPRASLTAAQTAGSILTFDINESGSTILSTKITIDNSEKTSTTAATPAVLSDTSLADDAEMTVDFDQVGTALAKGVKITLIGYPT